MSRLKDLLEAEIKYQNGRILTSSADFFKDSGITPEECAEAVKNVRASKQYRELMDEGFTETSGPIQIKRATFQFKPNTSSPKWKGTYFEFTCFPTGLVRASTGSLGGKPYELKAPAPAQITDKNSHTNVMTTNVLTAIELCLEKLGKAISQKATKAANRQKEAERLESYNWPAGFDMRVWEKTPSFCKRFKDGTYQLNVKEYQTVYIKMDNSFDKLPIEISEVRRNVGAISAKKRDDYLYLDLECKEGFKDFTGFPRKLKTLTVHNPIDWKEAAEYFDDIQEIKFQNNSWKREDYDFPMMKLLAMDGLRKINVQNWGGTDSEFVKKLLDVLNAGVSKQLDEFEVQERLMDLGLKKAPR